MLLWTSSLATLLCMCFSLNAPAREGRLAEMAPVCRIDLRPMMHAEEAPQLGGRRESRLPPTRSFGFLDNNRLVASIVTVATSPPDLARRDDPDANFPFRLRTAMFECSSGRLLGARDWPSNSRFAVIAAVNDHGFVVLAGNQLTQFTPDLVATRRLTIPFSTAAGKQGGGNNWGPYSSLTGQHILLVSGPAWATRPWVWVDAGTLQILQSWDDAATGAVTVSDEEMVMQQFSQQLGDAKRTLVRKVPGGSWRPIPTTLGGSEPRFVAPNTLYFQRLKTIDYPVPTKGFLVDSDGADLRSVSQGQKGAGPGLAAGSRGGNRFVILLTELQGSRPVLDVGGHTALKGLLIYDAPFQTPSYTIAVRDSNGRNPSPALTPDGRHLAVLGSPAPVLEIFELPSSK